MQLMTQKPRQLALAEKLYWSYFNNELTGLVLYGGWGVGKSSYSIQVLKDLYQGDMWRKYLVFRPEEFIKVMSYLLYSGKRVPCVVWDDAGLWLFALDWNDPRVKDSVKFFNVARTCLGGLILTTPSLDMILKKILKIEGMLIGKITKETRRHNKNDRMAKLYKNSLAVWGKRYVTEVINDPYNVMLPNADYDWYKPLRDKAAKDALEQLSRTHGVQMTMEDLKEFDPYQTDESAHKILEHFKQKDAVEGEGYVDGS